MLDTDKITALGIDVADGLAYCADDPEFYVEMLAEYVHEGEANRVQLRQFFDEQDWDNYRIRAHSVKNTSRMIGAAALSERAHALELAAREQDAETILASHAVFLADYTALVDAIRGLIG